MTKVAEFKKLYDDAGVAIEIVKIDGIFGFTDDVLDYTFGLAKTLGARALSTEITTAPQEADRAAQFKRLGQFAEKHKMMIGYHGHTATSPRHWEEAFAVGKYNGANLDIGHFLSGNKTSPVPFLKQYHDRITHIHLKDKTVNDKNVEFGRGDTPIKEALQTIGDNKWNIQATIEFEIPGPWTSGCRRWPSACSTARPASWDRERCDRRQGHLGRRERTLTRVFLAMLKSGRAVARQGYVLPTERR
jgi:sugar phosphate isomerase/epimerase